MTDFQRPAALIADSRRRWVWNVVAVVALLVGLAALVWVAVVANARADQAEATAASLAEQVQDACESPGKLAGDDRDLCDHAEDVAADVQAGPRGPVGDVGPSGPPGSPGADSTVPGPRGEPGDDSTVPGPRGPRGEKGDTGDTGATGATGVTGPAGEPGADSTVPGPIGPTGPPGKDGKDGADGVDGHSIMPGTWECPDRQVLIGFTISATGEPTLHCTDPPPPAIIP